MFGMSLWGSVMLRVDSSDRKSESLTEVIEIVRKMLIKLSDNAHPQKLPHYSDQSI
jgi:hypothetical protein